MRYRRYKPKHRATVRAFLVAICCMILPFALVIVSCCDGDNANVTGVTDSGIIDIPSTEGTNPEVSATPVVPELREITTYAELADVIYTLDRHIVSLETVLEGITQDELHTEILQLLEEITAQRNEYREYYMNSYQTRYEERPYLSRIWEFLLSCGYSPEVSAGILGNMVVEAGHHGYRDIDPFNWDDSTGCSYYGVCQWSIQYNPDIADSSLEYQLDYLLRTIESTINTVYKKPNQEYNPLRNEFNLNNLRYADFLELTSPYDAAIAFAVCYERCGASHVLVRGTTAENVYEYYTQINSWPWP